MSSLPSTRGFIFIILRSKCACPFLWKETLSLSSKAICYPNILENTAQNKGQPMPHCQDTHQCERSMKNCLWQSELPAKVCTAVFKPRPLFTPLYYFPINTQVTTAFSEHTAFHFLEALLLPISETLKSSWQDLESRYWILSIPESTLL